MSNALTAPPPLLRRSVVSGPKLARYRIRQGETPVGTLLATSHADALLRFMLGREPLPAGVELRAYVVLDLDAEAQR